MHIRYVNLKNEQTGINMLTYLGNDTYEYHTHSGTTVKLTAEDIEELVVLASREKSLCTINSNRSLCEEQFPVETD